MTFEEFMRLPLESRKKIEQAILDLDKAVQDQYGFSMLGTEKRLMRKLNETTPPNTPSSNSLVENDRASGGEGGEKGKL